MMESVEVKICCSVSLKIYAFIYIYTYIRYSDNFTSLYKTSSMMFGIPIGNGRKLNMLPLGLHSFQGKF